MTRVAILFAFRASDPDRAAAFEWLQQRWRHHWPEAQIVVADDGGTPFSKAASMNLAHSQALDADVYVCADADAWADARALRDAVEAVARPRPRRWGNPRACDKLGEAFTRAILTQDPLGPFPPTGLDPKPEARQVAPQGHVFVIPRGAWEAVRGWDDRFRGWGGEDNALRFALTTLWGQEVKFPFTSKHLWHPVLKVGKHKTYPGQVARNSGLRNEYKAASGQPDAMRHVIARRWEGAPAVTVDGVTLELHPSPDYVSDRIRQTGDFYERPVLDAAREHVARPGVIVDAGAMIGNHSLYFASRLPHEAVYAFEPLERNFELLARNVAPWTTVRPHLAALSDREGELVLESEDGNFGHTFVGDGGQRARCVTLDSFGLENVTLLKVDVEGHERQVLEGARATIERDRPVLIVEDWTGEALPGKMFGYELQQAWTRMQTYLWLPR